MYSGISAHTIMYCLHEKNQTLYLCVYQSHMPIKYVFGLCKLERIISNVKQFYQYNIF